MNIKRCILLSALVILFILSFTWKNHHNILNTIGSSSFLANSDLFYGHVLIKGKQNEHPKMSEYFNNSNDLQNENRTNKPKYKTETDLFEYNKIHVDKIIQNGDKEHEFS